MLGQDRKMLAEDILALEYRKCEYVMQIEGLEPQLSVDIEPFLTEIAQVHLLLDHEASKKQNQQESLDKCSKRKLQLQQKEQSEKKTQEKIKLHLQQLQTELYQSPEIVTHFEGLRKLADKHSIKNIIEIFIKQFKQKHTSKEPEKKLIDFIQIFSSSYIVKEFIEGITELKALYHHISQNQKWNQEKSEQESNLQKSCKEQKSIQEEIKQIDKQIWLNKINIEIINSECQKLNKQLKPYQKKLMEVVEQKVVNFTEDYRDSYDEHNISILSTHFRQETVQEYSLLIQNLTRIKKQLKIVYHCFQINDIVLQQALSRYRMPQETVEDSYDNSFSENQSFEWQKFQQSRFLNLTAQNKQPSQKQNTHPKLQFTVYRKTHIGSLLRKKGKEKHHQNPHFTRIIDQSQKRIVRITKEYICLCPTRHSNRTYALTQKLQLEKIDNIELVDNKICILHLPKSQMELHFVKGNTKQFQKVVSAAKRQNKLRG